MSIKPPQLLSWFGVDIMVWKKLIPLLYCPLDNRRVPKCFYNKQKTNVPQERRQSVADWTEEQIRKFMRDEGAYNETNDGIIIVAPSGIKILITPHILYRAWNRLGSLDKNTNYADKLESEFLVSSQESESLNSVMENQLSEGVRELIIKVVENGEYYYDLCRVYDRNYPYDEFIRNKRPLLKEAIEKLEDDRDKKLHKYLERMKVHLKRAKTEEGIKQIKQKVPEVVNLMKQDCEMNIQDLKDERINHKPNHYCFVIGNIPFLMKIDDGDENILVLVNTYAPHDSVVKNRWVSHASRNRWVGLRT